MTLYLCQTAQRRVKRVVGLSRGPRRWTRLSSRLSQHLHFHLHFEPPPLTCEPGLELVSDVRGQPDKPALGRLRLATGVRAVPLSRTGTLRGRLTAGRFGFGRGNPLYLLLIALIVLARSRMTGDTVTIGATTSPHFSRAVKKEG